MPAGRTRCPDHRTSCTPPSPASLNSKPSTATHHQSSPLLPHLQTMGLCCSPALFLSLLCSALHSAAPEANSVRLASPQTRDRSRGEQATTDACTHIGDKAGMETGQSHRRAHMPSRPWLPDTASDKATSCVEKERRRVAPARHEGHSRMFYQLGPTENDKGKVTERQSEREGDREMQREGMNMQKTKKEG